MNTKTALTAPTAPTLIAGLDARPCEAALLGAAMRYPHTAGLVLDDLDEQDFTDPRHRAVLAAVRLLLNHGVPPDPGLVVAQLHRANGTDALGGAIEPADRCWETVVFGCYAVTTATFPAAAPYYRRALLEARLRRDAEAFAARLSQAAGTGSLEHVYDVLDTSTRYVARTLARIAAQTDHTPDAADVARLSAVAS